MAIKLTVNMMIIIMVAGASIAAIAPGLMIAIPPTTKALQKVKSINRKQVVLPTEKRGIILGYMLVFFGLLFAASYPVIKNSQAVHGVAQAFIPGSYEKNKSLLAEAKNIIDKIPEKKKSGEPFYSITINGEKRKIKIGQEASDGVKLMAVKGNYYVFESKGEKIIVKIGSGINTEAPVHKEIKATFNIL